MEFANVRWQRQSDSDVSLFHIGFFFLIALYQGLQQLEGVIVASKI